MTNTAQIVSPKRILDTGFAFWGSKVLLTAVELGVFTALGNRAMTGDELGKALKLHPRGIYDFLDTLLSMGFLEREGDGSQAKSERTAALRIQIRLGY